MGLKRAPARHVCQTARYGYHQRVFRRACGAGREAQRQSRGNPATQSQEANAYVGPRNWGDAEAMLVRPPEIRYLLSTAQETAPRKAIGG